MTNPFPRTLGVVVVRLACPDTGTIGKERSIELFVKGVSILKTAVTATQANMTSAALSSALVARINGSANPVVRATPGDTNNVVMLYIASESASDVVILCDNNVSQTEFGQLVMQTEVAYFDVEYTALAERYASIYEYATLLESLSTVPSSGSDNLRAVGHLAIGVLAGVIAQKIVTK